MPSLTARSKYADLSQSYKLYYVLSAGGFLSIFSFALYNNFFVALTMAVCTVVVYLVLSRKPEPINFTTSEYGVSIDGNEFAWSDCVAWAAVELPEATELVIETTSMQQKYIYVYINPSQAGVSDCLADLSTNLTYQESMPYANVTHNALRRFGLI
jgi:hypothetical protein